MDVDVAARSAGELTAENAALRDRVAQLESELAEQAARTNAIVAAAEERTYWLDRWHLDVNELMRRPGAAQFRAALRLVRWPVRQLMAAKRQLLG